MNTKLRILAVSTCLISGLNAPLLQAAEDTQAKETKKKGWDFKLNGQPRAFAGMMNFQHKTTDSYITVTDTTDTTDYKELSRVPINVTVKDNLPIAGIGGTLVYNNKFYIDIYGQKSGIGKDVDTGINNGSYADEVKRQDYAFTVGYAALKNLSVFAGYKAGKTEFKINRYSAIRIPDINNPGKTIDYARDNEILGINFETGGIFIGASYGIPIGKKGLLGLNAAYARLDQGNYDVLHSSNVISLEGEELSNTTTPYEHLVPGATGITLGVNWKGRIKKNLVYTIALDAYRYQMPLEQSVTTLSALGRKNTTTTFTDLEERMFSFKLSLAYRF